MSSSDKSLTSVCSCTLIVVGMRVLNISSCSCFRGDGGGTKSSSLFDKMTLEAFFARGLVLVFFSSTALEGRCLVSNGNDRRLTSESMYSSVKLNFFIVNSNLYSVRPVGSRYCSPRLNASMRCWMKPNGGRPLFLAASLTHLTQRLSSDEPEGLLKHCEKRR